MISSDLKTLIDDTTIVLFLKPLVVHTSKYLILSKLKHQKW